jgi:hypothetical protein
MSLKVGKLESLKVKSKIQKISLGNLKIGGTLERASRHARSEYEHWREGTSGTESIFKRFKIRKKVKI